MTGTVDRARDSGHARRVCDFSREISSSLPVEKAPNAFGVVSVLAIGAVILGSGLAIAIYRGRRNDPMDVEPLRHKLYFDELYSWLIHWSQELLAHVVGFR